MRVINLLPWRELQYQRRRRKFVAVLLIVAAASITVAAAEQWKGRQERNDYDARVTISRDILSGVALHHLSLTQTAAELAELSSTLQSRQQQWSRQRDWQQLMLEWQLLAAEAGISDITLQEGQVFLRGTSNSVEPLRRVTQETGKWRLQKIELDSEARYQFVVTRDVQPVSEL